MRTLVTGANGFVGAALCRRLTALGHSVKALVRAGADTASIAGVPGVFLERGDVTQPQTLAGAVTDCEVVFHLAGIRRASRREEFLAVNAEGTRHLCEALVRRGGRARLVLCGSLAAAGPSRPDAPLSEEDPLVPYEWYGESKADAERIAFSYASALEVTVARPPRILGPGDRENLAFFRLVAKGWRLQIGGGPRPLTVVDVDDVVGLLLALAEHPAARGEAFFVPGPTTTLDELMEIAARLLGRATRKLFIPAPVLRAMAAAADGFSLLSGKRLPLNRKLARQLLAPAWTCSGEKAARLLGFRPTVGLEASIRRSLESYQSAQLL